MPNPERSINGLKRRDNRRGVLGAARAERQRELGALGASRARAYALSPA